VASDHPLLDVRLFAIPQFLIANVVGWVSTIALFGAEFLLPLYLQTLRGLTAVDTGLLLMPQGLSAAVAGPLGGRLVDRIGARWVVMFGFTLLAFNTWQLSQITLTTSYTELRWLLVARGLALGFSLQPTQLVALAVIPDHLRTSASSLNNALRNIFSSFGIAMLSTIVATQSVVHTAVLGWQVRPDTTQGLFLSQASALLQQRVALPAGIADATVVSLVLGQIRQLAAVMAFGDAYRVTFVASLAAIALATLLPGRGLRTGGPESMASH
jgi:MFS transporter, DHA2 family, multidrug resistance protein